MGRLWPTYRKWELAAMPRTAPWHSKNTIYFHDNDQCDEGKKVRPVDRLEGTGNKAQCVNCALLHYVEK
jgi:hypothetical protein